MSIHIMTDSIINLCCSLPVYIVYTVYTVYTHR